MSVLEKKSGFNKMKLILNTSTEVWIKKTEVLMKSLEKKMSLFVLLAIVGALTLQCEKKEDNQNETLLLGLAALTYSPGDCAVFASGKAQINTWTNDITGTTSGTPPKLSTMGIGHVTTAMKLTGDGSTSMTVQGSAFIIVYKSSTCPLGTNNVAVRGTDYSISGGADSNGEFPDSYKITNQTASITFTASTGFYVFIYAIPRSGQSAAVTYTFSQ